MLLFWDLRNKRVGKNLRRVPKSALVLSLRPALKNRSPVTKINDESECQEKDHFRFEDSLDRYHHKGSEHSDRPGTRHLSRLSEGLQNIHN